MTMIEVEPQPRIDTLVAADGRRRGNPNTPARHGLTASPSFWVDAAAITQRAEGNPDAELLGVVLRPGQPAV
jgi:hypothetical protein